MDPQFNYDESMTFEENFNVWYDMNCRERSNYNEELYTKEEGLKIFEEMYGINITN